MDGKIEKLLKLGKSPEELQRFISKLDAKTLCGMVGSALYARNICDVLLYVFAGLSSSESCQTKRYKVIEKLLNELRNEGKETCYKENEIFVIVNTQIQKLDSKYLVNLSEYCLEWAQNGSSKRTGWKLLLSNLLNLLSMKSSVESEDGDVKSGAAYLSESVKSLCAVQWRPAVLTNLATVFCDVGLSTKDHLELVIMLCRCMHRMSPADLPLYTYQLLILCRLEHSVPVFMNLNHYFHSRLRTDADSGSGDSMEAAIEKFPFLSSYFPTTGISVQVANEMSPSAHRSSPLQLDESEVQDVEERVLLQICFPEINTSDLFRHLVAILAAPDLILKHFTFALLLSLSTVERQEEQVCDFIRKVFLRCHTEENRRKTSQWLTSMFPQENKAELTVSFFIQQRSCGNSIVLRGLLNLGFTLMKIKTIPGKDSNPEKVWSLGSYIIVSLSKTVRGNTGLVLKRLYRLIMSSDAMPHYAGCLHELCLRVPKEVYECRKEIAQFVSNLLYMRSEMAEGVVKALMPLTKTFQPVKDALIIVLRKALYVNDTAKRQMGVRGILDLLKQQGLRGLSVLTQNFVHPEGLLTPISDSPVSQHSSQVSADSNSICQEVLSILQTVFQKQGPEKIILYSGLCDSSVFKNTNLLPAVQDLLWSQLQKYVVPDEATLPPLNFNEAVVVQGVKAVVKEPLAHLVYVNQRMLTYKHSDSQFIDTDTQEGILNSLCVRMVETRLEDFDFGSSDFLTDNLPESLQKQEVVRMVLNTYEAFISYRVDSWTVDSQDHGSSIANLYDGYSSIVEFVKTSAKSSKKVDNDDTQPGKRKRRSGADGGATAKHSPFKLPPSVLSFESANRLLELFQNGPVRWSCPEAANELKGKRHFWRYVMQAILSLTAQFQSLKPTEMKNSPMVAEIMKCGRLLYKNFVTKQQETVAFDYVCTSLAVECLYEIFNTVFTHLKSVTSKLLAELGLNFSQVLDDQLGALIERYKMLLEQSMELEEGEEEPELRKNTHMLIHTVTLIVRQLSRKNLEQVYTWVMDLVENGELTNVQAAKAVISLLLELHHRCKLRGPLLANMAKFLCLSRGSLSEEATTEGPKFKVITKTVEMYTYGMLCHWINQSLNDIKWTVSWLKAQCYSQMKSGVTICDDTGRWDELREKERATCLHLSHVIQELAQVSAVMAPVGQMTDAMFRTLLLTYDTLHLLVKYFMLRSTRTNQAYQYAKLEGVIRVIKKVLQPRFSDLMHYVSQSAGSGTDGEKSAKKKKKLSLDPLAKKTKAMNETKLIPKVIYAKEQFEKVVVMLSKKTKSNLEDVLGGPKDQDFKIRLCIGNEDD